MTHASFHQMVMGSKSVPAAPEAADLLDAPIEVLLAMRHRQGCTAVRLQASGCAGSHLPRFQVSARLDTLLPQSRSFDL